MTLAKQFHWNYEVKNQIGVGLKENKGAFPGVPEVKDPSANGEDMVQSLVRELRSHMPWGN